jgi:UDP-glucose 4-epimerase
MSRVLVVGGAGYIGAHVSQVLVDQGYEVRIFDDFSNGLERRVNNRFDDVVRDDVLNREALLNAMENMDAVIHLAAKKSVEESVSNPLKYYENNTGGTLNILAAMAARGVKRIVFSSTAAVYAPNQKSEIEETDEIGPLSPYGATKVMSEELIKNVGSAEGFSTVSLRYFNVVGSANVEFGDNSKDNLVPKRSMARITQQKMERVFETTFMLETWQKLTSLHSKQSKRRIFTRSTTLDLAQVIQSWR